MKSKIGLFTFLVNKTEGVIMQRVHAVTFSLLLGLAISVQAQNLITNPGFEAETPGNYWSLWKDSSAAAANATITFPGSGVQQGNSYARVEVTVPSTENWHIQLQIPPDWIADSGVTYDLKFWAKSDSSRSIHVGIQDGPDGQFAYRSGMDFSLTPEWTEYSLSYTSDRQGNGTVRFNLYLGLNVDTYGFDSFSLMAQAPVAIRTAKNPGRVQRFNQAASRMTFTLDGKSQVQEKAARFDLRGVRLD